MVAFVRMLVEDKLQCFNIPNDVKVFKISTT